MKKIKLITLILFIIFPFLLEAQVMPVSFFQRNNLSGAGDGKTSATAGTSALQIKTDYPVNFQIDGEYCGAQTSLEIHILHKQMKLAVP